jgi:hypothetical protein
VRARAFKNRALRRAETFDLNFCLFFCLIFFSGVCPYEPSEIGLSEDEEPPDLSLDPEDSLLSVINSSKTLEKAFYITFYHPAINGRNEEMELGLERDENGEVCVYICTHTHTHTHIHTHTHKQRERE